MGSLFHLVGRQATLELAKMMLAALALFPLLTSPTLAAIRNRMPDLCVTTTGDPCVFPFTYKGVDYLDCTFQDSPTPWCATMVDFSGKVITNRNPSCITTGGPSSGRPCVFPFTYNGVTYREC